MKMEKWEVYMAGREYNPSWQLIKVENSKGEAVLTLNHWRMLYPRNHFKIVLVHYVRQEVGVVYES